jgi:hypothetical protein
MKKANVKLKALMDEDSDENSDFEKELAKGNCHLLSLMKIAEYVKGVDVIAVLLPLFAPSDTL